MNYKKSDEKKDNVVAVYFDREIYRRIVEESKRLDISKSRVISDIVYSKLKGK